MLLSLGTEYSLSWQTALLALGEEDDHAPKLLDQVLGLVIKSLQSLSVFAQNGDRKCYDLRLQAPRLVQQRNRDF